MGLDGGGDEWSVDSWAGWPALWARRPAACGVSGQRWEVFRVPTAYRGWLGNRSQICMQSVRAAWVMVWSPENRDSMRQPRRISGSAISHYGRKQGDLNEIKQNSSLKPSQPEVYPWDLNPNLVSLGHGGQCSKAGPFCTVLLHCQQMSVSVALPSIQQ